ncbi:MAG: alpha/beta hydrolase [Muribaculaceae bacterium]|nr:alpha/beta hydrolase [Muribaculaceae bacterium]
MPKRFVNDTDIMYEAYGRGETIVYLQSVLGGINPGAYYFAGRMSKNFRVIIWDGPNCGQSGVSIKHTDSEYHLACEYLAGLLDVLGEKSIHIAGCSGGGEMGLLFTHLYPDRVKSLAMYRPTDTSCTIEREVIRARYFDIAQRAEKSMREAISYSGNPPAEGFGNCSRWLADLYRKEKNKILEMDNRVFAEIMQTWGKWMENPLFYRANLCDRDLSGIKIPVLICPCPDDYHPESLAENLHDRLPNSTYIPSKKHRSQREIYDEAHDENAFGGFVDYVDEYEKFMSC